jgi:hypothetical protein
VALLHQLGILVYHLVVKVHARLDGIAEIQVGDLHHLGGERVARGGCTTGSTGIIYFVDHRFMPILRCGMCVIERRRWLSAGPRRAEVVNVQLTGFAYAA